MKKALILILVNLISLRLCRANEIYHPDSSKANIRHLIIDDSIKFEFELYNNNKIHTIKTFTIRNNHILQNGYEYEFTPKGELAKIQLYRLGLKTSFLLEQMSGKIDSFISPDGQNILTTIKANILKNGTATQLNYFYTADSLDGYVYFYDLNSQYLISFNEVAYSVNCPKNGIMCNFRKGHVFLIKNYLCNIEYRENIYFTQKGRVFMFEVTGINGEKRAIKANLLYKYL